MVCHRPQPGDSRGPPLEGGDGEKRHHPGQDVVEVEVAVVPQALAHGGVGDVPILVHQERAPGGQGDIGDTGDMSLSLYTRNVPLGDTGLGTLGTSGTQHPLALPWCVFGLVGAAVELALGTAGGSGGPHPSGGVWGPPDGFGDPSGGFWDPLPHLEELHSDAGEHELQQRGHDHDVADGADGDEDALDHVLGTRGQTDVGTRGRTDVGTQEWRDGHTGTPHVADRGTDTQGDRGTKGQGNMGAPGAGDRGTDRRGDTGTDTWGHDVLGTQGCQGHGDR